MRITQNEAVPRATNKLASIICVLTLLFAIVFSQGCGFDPSSRSSSTGGPSRVEHGPQMTSPNLRDQGAKARATSPPETKKSSPKEVLEAVAGYVSSERDAIGSLLNDIGFVSSVPVETWRSFSAIHKMEVAWRAAEAADPDRGGEFLLAKLARTLAAQHSAINEEPALRRYLAITFPPDKLAFVEPTPDQVHVELPREVREALRTLATYVSTGPLGSQVHILTRYFRISEDMAIDILRTNRPFSEQLVLSLSKTDTAHHDDIVRDLVVDVASHYKAAKSEPAFQRFLEAGRAGEGGPSGPIEPAPRPSPTGPPPTPTGGPRSGAVEIRNSGNSAMDLYVDGRLAGRVPGGATATFNMPPGSHAMAWRDPAPRSPLKTEKPVTIVPGVRSTFTVKTTVKTCTRTCTNGNCSPWNCPPGVSPPPP